MHPVESSTYFTAMLVPVIFGAHPIIMLYTKMDLSLAALIGHSGIADVGNASQPHTIHHEFKDVNFGENYFPMDHWFGTFAATPEEAEALARKFHTEEEALNAKEKKAEGKAQ